MKRTADIVFLANNSYIATGVHKRTAVEMDSDFFGIIWTLFILFLGIGVPIIEKISKKHKDQMKSGGGVPPSRIPRRPSAGTSIGIPDRKQSFSPIKVDDPEQAKWPERKLTPSTPAPASGEDITRDILSKIFGEDIFGMDDKEEAPVPETFPSAVSPDDEGVCSLDTHEPRPGSSAQTVPKEAPKPAFAPVVEHAEKRKIVDDPKKLVVYAEIMKPKYDEF